ncbi:hypothetical protein ETD86_42685 [Nonomuraea turkmeniaca]|uniref:Uncharacterized protein n=1 Tax=Nonomuraea turkmeniaca TaxID=103838 RepID=A0A5S4F0T3_9ACTN|nr:hypothetical protein [Nonomuraea turkmeniaca]TMR09665.1 hypothetical protein ETD86_42685 [Nonomuraea turkmeniaca]
MDVQAEVLEEAAPVRYVDLLREVDDRTRHLRAEIAALRTELAAARAELGEDVAAVQTEVEGVRRAVNAGPGESGDEDGDLRLDMLEGFAAVRAEIAHEFGSVRSEMLDLGIKLDRLLNRDGCR